MGQLSQEQINVDLFNEVQRLKKQLQQAKATIKKYEKALKESKHMIHEAIMSEYKNKTLVPAYQLLQQALEGEEQ